MHRIGSERQDIRYKRGKNPTVLYRLFVPDIRFDLFAHPDKRLYDKAMLYSYTLLLLFVIIFYYYYNLIESKKTITIVANF